jgi:DNA-binding PadR family transcriptional regulator
MYLLSTISMPSDEETAASNWLKETQKGYIRIATLTLLSKRPYHGYEIMKEIRERTRGFWRPTAGGMYPILKDLQESAYIEGKWDVKTRRRKRIYKITQSGTAVLRRALEKENQLAETMRNLFEEYLKGVLDVNPQPVSPFTVPRPLAELLKETNENEETTIKRLEEQIKQIQDMSKQLRKRHLDTKKKLRELKRKAPAARVG